MFPKTLLNRWESVMRRGGALQVRKWVRCDSMMSQGISPVELLWDRRLETPSKFVVEGGVLTVKIVNNYLNMSIWRVCFTMPENLVAQISSIFTLFHQFPDPLSFLRLVK